MEAWEAALTFQPEQMTGQYAVLVAADGQLLGFYGLESREEGWLEHCWVDPQSIGSGHGRHLVEHALSVVRGLGVNTLAVESDPSARGFYERLGAQHVRDGRARYVVSPDVCQYLSGSSITTL
jgi:GNAT superfamily N-acetyltransferase